MKVVLVLFTNIDTKSTQNRHKGSKIDTKWSVLCRFLWGRGYMEPTTFTKIVILVSSFVSEMSGQCQKYVANLEVVGIPPQTGGRPAKRKRILFWWGGFRFQKFRAGFLPFCWAPCWAVNRSALAYDLRALAFRFSLYNPAKFIR